jgi:hypothetical protein
VTKLETTDEEGLLQASLTASQAREILKNRKANGYQIQFLKRPDLQETC